MYHHLSITLIKFFQLSEKTCFWRQTGGCSWDDTSGSDKGCYDTIADSWSGYCECADGTKTMKKGCGEKGAFSSCILACHADGPSSKLFCTLVQNIHNHV